MQPQPKQVKHPPSLQSKNWIALSPSAPRNDDTGTSLRAQRSNPEIHKLHENCYHSLKNIFFLLLFLYPFPLLAEFPSLFFTETEINLIKNKFLFQNKLEKIEITPENLYSSAILYVDNTHWTLWLNHQMVHASDPHPISGYHIEKVTPLAAVFSYLPSQPSPPKKFTLPVHHIFLGTENKIIKINE